MWPSRHLHRWGSAFPDAPLLPEAHSLVPNVSMLKGAVPVVPQLPPPPPLGRKALGLGGSALSGEASPSHRSAVAAHGEAVSLRHGLLSVRLSTSRSARVAFCGDFVRTEGEGGAARAGSVEGAALSGLRLAEQLKLVI